MKKYIFITTILLLVFNLKFATSQNQSINFNGNDIVFSCSSEVFLSTFFDYSLCIDENQYERINVYCKILKGEIEYGEYYWIKTYFKFYDDKLFEIYINEQWVPEEYLEIINKLVKQFKVVREEYNDEEGGWFKQELKKDNLKGIYRGGSEATFFNCYDTNIIKEVKEQYPNYGE